MARGWCLICGDVGLADFILNSTLFIPFGMGLRLAGTSWLKTIAACAALTLSIELAQMTLVSGRDASAGDVVANTAGGIAGALVGTHWRNFLFASPGAARSLAWMAAAVASGVVVLSAIALRPSFPDVRLWGQIAPRLERFAHFEGTVRSATLGGEPVPASRFEDSDRARRHLVAERTLVEAVVEPAGPTPEIAPIVRIVDGEGREMLVLGQSGRALFFRLRRVGTEARVSTPGFALADVFPSSAPVGAAPVSVRVGASWSGDRMRLTAADASGERRRDIPLHALLGWRLLYPFTYDTGGDYLWASVVWLTLLLLPIAYWCSRPHDESRLLAWLPMLTAVALIGATVAAVSARLAMVLVPAAVLAALAASASMRAAADKLRLS